MAKTKKVLPDEGAETNANMGAPVKKGGKKKIILIVVACIVVLGIIGAAMSGQNSSTGTQASTSDGASNSQSNSAVEAISVTAKDLFAEYEENEVAADEKYKDKQVQISGTISDIGKDITDTPYITFVSSDNEYAILSVQCTFDNDAEAAKVSSLAKGQDVTLVGTVSGMFGNVLVKDCAIQ